MPTDLDANLMRRAVELATNGQGRVEPNPMVGCVIAQAGKVVGEGWHQRFGGPHAEVNALRAAGDAAHGATAYVTLEPCCHTGKTPPCAQALIDAGIARVVAAVRDPNPQVDGGGFKQLEAAGIVCEEGVCEEASRRVLAPYLKLTTTGRPWVIAKWAMTLDGKLATHTGSSQWISSEESRAIVHQIRGRMDAILVGAGTAQADDPLLTARPQGPRTATRIVLGGVSTQSKLAKTADQAPVLSVVRVASKPPNAVEQLLLPGSRGEQLAALLDELGRRRMTNLLIEGGAAVLGAAFDAALVDEVHVFIAPKIAGGTGAPSPVGGSGITDMQQALRLSDAEFSNPGGDLYVQGYVERDHCPVHA